MAPAKPLLEFIRDLAGDDEARTQFGLDPDGFLVDHGYDVSVGDVAEALDLAADALPPDEASRIMVLGAAGDTADLDDGGPADVGSPAHSPQFGVHVARGGDGGDPGDFFGQGAVDQPGPALSDDGFGSDSSAFVDALGDESAFGLEPDLTAIDDGAGFDSLDLDLRDVDGDVDHGSGADDATDVGVDDPDDFDTGSF